MADEKCRHFLVSDQRAAAVLFPVADEKSRHFSVSDQRGKAELAAVSKPKTDTVTSALSQEVPKLSTKSLGRVSDAPKLSTKGLGWVSDASQMIELSFAERILENKRFILIFFLAILQNADIA